MVSFKRELKPSALKLDVEGAERNVLLGAMRTLEDCKPVVVLEYDANLGEEDDAMLLLKTLGYVFYDANTYQKVNRERYLELETVFPVNVLALPPIVAQDWKPSVMPTTEVGVGAHPNNTASFLLQTRQKYILECKFDIQDDEFASLSAKTVSGDNLASFSARGSHLKGHACSSLVCRVQEPTEVFVTLEPLNGEDSSIAMKGCTISTVDLVE